MCSLTRLYSASGAQITRMTRGLGREKTHSKVTSQGLTLILTSSRRPKQSRLNSWKKFLEVSTPGGPLVGPSSLLIKFDYKLFLPICTLKARSSVLGHQPLAYDLSVLLAANKESMLVDPICWSVFTAKLRDWAEGNCTDCALDSNTDLKFRERRTPHHEARCLPMVN